MRIKLTIEVWQKGPWFIAKCPELDFVSQGPTVEQARDNLLEVIQIQFDEMTAANTLDDYLAECGYIKEDNLLEPRSERVAVETYAMQVA